MKNKLVNIVSRYKVFTDISLPMIILTSLALFIPLTGLTVGNGQVEISNLTWLYLSLSFVIGVSYVHFVLKYSPYQKEKEDKAEQRDIEKFAEVRGIGFEEARGIYDLIFPPLKDKE